MKETPTLQYFFRKPRFPVLVSIEGDLICGKSPNTLSRRLLKSEYVREKSYNAIDIKGEGWGFYPEHWLITPLSLKKRWTKLEIIKLYNSRKNKKNEDIIYSEKSLSTKRLDRIIADIVEILNKT